MSTCAHAETEPVEVRDHRTGRTEVVARVCVTCLDALHAGWGCTDCEWVEIRAFGEPAPELALGTPCEAHR